MDDVGQASLRTVVANAPSPVFAGLTPAQRQGLASAVDGWLASFPGRNTRRAYTLDMRLWLAWLDQAGVRIFDARPSNVDRFADGVRTGNVRIVKDQARLGDPDGRTRTESTVARRAATVSSFYEYAIGEELTDRPNPVRRRKPSVAGTVRKPVPLSRDQASRLLDEPDTATRILLTLLTVGGLRVSEAAQLRGEDVTVIADDHLVAHVKGKGGKVRQIDFYDSFVADWLALGRRHGPAFPGEADHGGLSYNEARRIVERATKAATGRAMRPHALRHTAASRALDAGVPIDEVQDMLGHADIKTTRGYATRTPDGANGPTRRLRAYLDSGMD